MATFPKQGKRIRTRRQLQAALDRAESAAVRKRSEGQCEVIVVISDGLSTGVFRCLTPATQVHHMLSGRGKRLSAEGVKRIRKQAVCNACHVDITGDIGGKRLFLVQSGELPHWTDRYERRSQKDAA